MSIGESYKNPPRIASTYSRTIFEEIEKIANNVDFRHPRFQGKYKRNRSLGSAQALIVELALTDERITKILHPILRSYMVEGGKHWIPIVHYKDKY